MGTLGSRFPWRIVRVDPEGASSPAPPMMRQLDPPSLAPGEQSAGSPPADLGATAIHWGVPPERLPTPETLASPQGGLGSEVAVHSTEAPPISATQLALQAELPSPMQRALGSLAERPQAGGPPGGHPNGTALAPDSSAHRAPLFSNRRIPIGLGVSLFAVGMALGMVWHHGAERSARAEPPAAAAPPVQDPVATPPPACVITRAPMRVAPRLEKGAGVNARAVGESGGMLVGYAEDRTTAIGMSLDWSDLHARRVFRDRDPRAVAAVVPMPEHDPRFRADRADAGPLRQRTTVAESQPFSIGLGNLGVVLETEASASRLLWPVTLGEEPRLIVASAVGMAHVVAVTGHRFQDGGIGWLGPRGERRSLWHPVAIPGAEHGTPAIAVDPREALFVVAVKDAPGRPWSLRGAIASWGEPLGPLSSVDLPETEDERSAPRVAALPRDRWMLQWTEGVRGRHEVKVVVFDDQLRRITEPVVVSPREGNAGAGEIAVAGSGVVSLFLVRREPAYELWATALSCG